MLVFNLVIIIYQSCVISVETNCDGRQNGAQCYGALGGTVVLQLINPSEIHRFKWTKNNIVIIYWRNNTFIENKIQDRSLFTPSDGTLRINNLSRNDGGEYKLEIHDSNGQTLSSRYLQFSIQAPVSSVLLVSECLSQGQMRVSCSSEGGDSPQYSWTLDGHTLTDAELLSGNKETNNITLKQHVSGNLVCSVRNHVSHVSKKKTISDCAPVSSVLLVSECLSQGQMRVSCSSEGGDSPQYSWTLDGHTLTDAELLSGNKETNNITLKQHVSGNLVCSVRNHVSHVSKEETISDCAPVSSVLLVSECLSQGLMRVSCSSEGGDSPQYSWTLDGHTLTDAELLSGNKETNNITLKQHVSGNLVCSVRNHVSHVSKEETISDCDNVPILAGVLSALVLLLVIGLAVICTQTRKKNIKPKNVRVTQRQERQLQQTAEVEVEYDQVRFSGRPRQTVRPSGDDCVYAKVCRDR
ncbi:hypothetical protein Q5P01_009031 [Channa striata]|uniref:Ig-like domain-containing protein n=1 Tax=Channa striata TaxID=64152 RepID=A0AA88ST89_CHASR|nr:hypothetical protein Q5P01_009031 [Channa striata]